MEDGTGALLSETAAISGHDILLESGSSSTLGSKLILDSQLIEIESGINDGEIPSVNFGDNSVFPTYSAPAMISTRPVGRVALQDESPKTLQTQEGDTGDDGGEYVSLFLELGHRYQDSQENRETAEEVRLLLT